MQKVNLTIEEWQRLAAVSPKEREKALRKLERWVHHVSQACKSAEKAVTSVLTEAIDYQSRNGLPLDEPLGELLVCDTEIKLCPAVKELIARGVSTIIQTGGTADDEEFIQYCDERNVVMVFTGMSHITY